MGRQYKERKDETQADIAKWCGQHVIVEEPVRSFRFHAHSVMKSHDRGITFHAPGFRTYAPSESARFAYTSTYCFTLTWTPGHMTIVGDLGELTIVHYQAMPTLLEACKWLNTPDVHYLLGKTNVKHEFCRAETIEDIWRQMTEGVEEHDRLYAEAMAEWQTEKPKWRKRDGMTKADFDWELKGWEENHPKHSFSFRERKTPSHGYSSLYSEADKIGWDIPDGFELMARAWKFFRDDYRCDADPNEAMLTPEGRDQLKSEIDSYCYDRSDEEIGGWIYRELDFSDYSGVYEYPHRAFIQIAAIQHGVRMILEQLAREGKVAA